MRAIDADRLLTDRIFVTGLIDELQGWEEEAT